MTTRAIPNRFNPALVRIAEREPYLRLEATQLSIRAIC
jgi:hypothetical protein